MIAKTNIFFTNQNGITPPKKSSNSKKHKTKTETIDRSKHNKITNTSQTDKTIPEENFKPKKNRHQIKVTIISPPKKIEKTITKIKPKVDRQ